MKLGNLRYYLALSCLVLGCSIPITGILVWIITEFVSPTTEHLTVLYVATYIIVVCVGFRVYGKRLRNII